jgi:hypothetical protein
MWQFIQDCRVGSAGFRFASSPNGPETLYASAFACMLYHYLGKLETISTSEKQAWAGYLNRWQNPETGYFIGPELVPEEMRSRKHSYEHIAQHLTAHVLPALSLLGAKPAYPLKDARAFLDQGHLEAWLNARNWQDAWLEGNNLLFIGQFLIHLRDVEGVSAAQSSLNQYLEWLDKEVDPSTGLWGTNGYCSIAAGLYGGYHQLLVYYYEGHPVPYPERLVDVALSLQHPDGGFNPGGGGGACEDVDAIDILVNMYKRVDYRRIEIRIALRRALQHILQRQMPDGGFVYHLDKPFIHMGVGRTASPANRSNLFPTWFRVHTLALISEILTDEPVAGFDWRFNDTCSMGWHPGWDPNTHAINWWDRQVELLHLARASLNQRAFRTMRAIRRMGGRVMRRFLQDKTNA